VTANRWQRVGDIYHEAVALGADERAAFLDAACGNDGDVRREVESLLAHAAEASGFLETPAVELAGRALAARTTSLIGQRLGQYEIRSFIGAGGMGEVYLAHDTRLERDVAIKCLPPHVASDASARARLEREARLLATLNHPNIAAIHGVEQADGVIGLVLEMVEGQTLADGSYPMREALGIARQIADALEAAHEKDVVHRDLKPANIKVTPGGVVKVLDFGLAKAISTDPQRGDNSSTHTRAGAIMGTAAYMSPEQARGKPVDRRADVWASDAYCMNCSHGERPLAPKPPPIAWSKSSSRNPTGRVCPGKRPSRYGDCSDAVSRRIPPFAFAISPMPGSTSSRRCRRHP
jgi:serine/threonine protein kinase